MARLEQIPEPMRSRLIALECPNFETQPWAEGPPLKQRRVAIVSTSGLHRGGDRPFKLMSEDYRVIPDDVEAKDLVMSHVSTNFDRTGFQQDWNVVFPLDRLHELASQGVIGSAAGFHYSFMGATDPTLMEATARNLAKLFHKDHVNAVLLIPV